MKLQNEIYREKMSSFQGSSSSEKTRRQGGQSQGVPLFVFMLSDPKQNARSLLTPVSGTVFMLFHMVALVLLSMVAFLTIFLLAENL